jgi:iron complex transport system substrate-binding protein
MNRLPWVSIPLLLTVCLSTSAFGKSESKRIVSLSLASDEILLDLLPSCGGTARLVALSSLVDHDEYSNVTAKAKTVPGRAHSEAESLFKLKPDLVFAASFNRPELLTMIRSKAIALKTLQNFYNAEDIAHNIKTIGKAIACDHAAKVMIDKFLGEAAPTPVLGTRISLLLYNPDGVIMGQNTLFDDLVYRAGGLNAARKAGLTGWPKVNSETILSLNPDALVIFSKDTPSVRSQIAKHSTWQHLSAVKQRRFIFLTPQTAQSTSHYFSHAVRELRSILREITPDH